jgi:hypothetical protein
MRKRTYRISEVADLLNTSESQVYRLIQWDELESPKAGFVSGKSLRLLTMGTFRGFTYGQFATFCSVSPKTIQRLVREGKLDYFRVNPDSRNNKSIRIPLTLKNVELLVTTFLPRQLKQTKKKTDYFRRQTRKILREYLI